MASAVRNHVADGLNGISSTSFSGAYTDTSNYPVIVKLSAQGLWINKFQRIDGIRIECKDFISKLL
jgi:hypothetical protein